MDDAPKPAEVSVKEERPDEAEIRELAAKMVEANKAKVPAPPPNQQIINQNLSGILNYFNKKAQLAETNSGKIAPADGKVPLDDESARFRFAWSTFGEVHIPHIFRASDTYCAVRMLEQKLLNKYLNYLSSDIYSCTCIRSYYITDAESRCLNEINNKHCENQFGREQFTTKDLVVRVVDAKEFYAFLDVCYVKLTSGSNQNAMAANKTNKCGFIRINKESVVPYTVKDGLKYVPLFYFEGETENLKQKAEKLEGWDLSYLKFCCKVQGIRNELFASETCSVISLNDIKNYFAPGTSFEDYWPNKVMDSQLLVSSKGNGSGGGWTKQPSLPPPPPSMKSSINNVNKNSVNSRSGSMHNMLPRNSVANSMSQRVNQPRPVGTTLPVHSTAAVVSSARSVNQSMMNAVQSVNGWTGLVGGQPAYQALVSQSNNILQMSNINIHNLNQSNKSYNQQQQSRSRTNAGNTQYQVFPTTSLPQAAHVQQPPPLIRSSGVHSTQPNLGYPTYGKDDWVNTTYASPQINVPNPANSATYSQILNLNVDQVSSLIPSPTSATLLPSPPAHTPPVMNSSHSSKYPPPLIPVNGSTNNTRDSRGRKPLIPIAETHTSSTCSVQPYQVQKALVEDKLVPCINFKPYIYSELLMTLPDFISQYFPNCDLESCRQVLVDVLHVELYQGNRSQMEMLMKNGKCSSLTEELPLIPVKIIMKFMPQLKYMLSNRSMTMPSSSHSPEDHAAKKRQRTS